MSKIHQQNKMKFIRGMMNLHNALSPCVATIGAFDGMHRGHQQVLRQLIREAKEHQSPSTVILFEPQPKEFFAPELATPRLMRLRDKLIFLKQFGIDQVLCLRFNNQFSQILAQDFVKTILVDGLRIQHVILGDDCRFGFQRQGNFELLQQLGQQCNFTVSDTKTLKQQGIRTSSSQARQAVITGDFSLAEKLLGHPYQLSGRIHHGDKRGRQLGFPTLNIRLHLPVAVHGVYDVLVKGLDNNTYRGVANVGRRPTTNQSSRLLEVYLLDFNRECYGETITVIFQRKLRDEKKFSSFAALKAQIQQDIAHINAAH